MAEVQVPEELLYSDDDEWARAEEGRVVVGITDYAQQQLGDIVYVELPEVGTAVQRGDEFGVIESVKAVSPLFSPVAGEVVEVNGALADRPEAVNEDCYGAGWMIQIACEPGATEGLRDADSYRRYVDERSD